MDRCAVFVDAGYLFAAGGWLLTQRKVTRGELSIDVDAVEEFLRTFAEREAGLPLLRVYWYDGTASGPTADHTRLMWTRNIKVRLGIVNTFGEQKGVDSLLVSDMIDLARTGRVATAFVLTGDEDLRVGVQQAQAAGLRVHLVGISPTRENQSDLLQQEADQRHTLELADLRKFLSPRVQLPSVNAVIPNNADRAEIIRIVVDAVLASFDAPQRQQYRQSFAAGTFSIPRDLDRALLKALEGHLPEVTEDDKRQGRSLVKTHV